MNEGGETLKDLRESGDDDDLEKGEDDERSDSDSVSLKSVSRLILRPHSGERMKSIPKDSLCCMLRRELLTLLRSSSD